MDRKMIERPKISPKYQSKKKIMTRVKINDKYEK